MRHCKGGEKCCPDQSAVRTTFFVESYRLRGLSTCIPFSSAVKSAWTKLSPKLQRTWHSVHSIIAMKLCHLYYNVIHSSSRRPQVRFVPLISYFLPTNCINSHLATVLAKPWTYVHFISCKITKPKIFSIIFIFTAFDYIFHCFFKYWAQYCFRGNVVYLETNEIYLLFLL